MVDEQLVTRVMEHDPVGAETLRMIYEMRKLNEWIYSLIADQLGDDVLEIGCGIGCFTELLLDRKRVVAVDINPSYVEYLQHRFSAQENLQVLQHDLNDPLPATEHSRPVDSVICLNVLEHIEDDRGALRHMRDELSPGGNLMLLVPAYAWLYSPLDRELGHYRRYTRKGLDALLRETGFVPQRHHYLNTFGILGWLINGKLLRREILPSGQLRLYNHLVPLFRWLERVTGPPMGLSHVVVAQRGEG